MKYSVKHASLVDKRTEICAYESGYSLEELNELVEALNKGVMKEEGTLEFSENNFDGYVIVRKK